MPWLGIVSTLLHAVSVIQSDEFFTNPDTFVKKINKKRERKKKFDVIHE